MYQKKSEHPQHGYNFIIFRVRYFFGESLENFFLENAKFFTLYWKSQSVNFQGTPRGREGTPVGKRAWTSRDFPGHVRFGHGPRYERTRQRNRHEESCGILLAPGNFKSCERFPRRDPVKYRRVHYVSQLAKIQQMLPLRLLCQDLSPDLGHSDHVHENEEFLFILVVSTIFFFSLWMYEPLGNFLSGYAFTNVPSPWFIHSYFFTILSKTIPEPAKCRRIKKPIMNIYFPWALFQITEPDLRQWPRTFPSQFLTIVTNSLFVNREVKQCAELSGNIKTLKIAYTFKILPWNFTQRT